MNAYLAELYGTAGTTKEASAAESQAKLAQLDLFAKLAADHNVDLTTLTPEETVMLYNEVMLKSASEETTPPEKKEETSGTGSLPPALAANAEKKEEEKKKEEEEKAAAALLARATAEFEEKKASQQKIAEAELMGQVLAHSFVRELNEIQKHASESNAPAAAAQTTASKTASAPATLEGVSALDIAAGRHAVKLAHDQGYNAQETEQRILAVLTLGAPESTKVAMANNPSDGIHVRALELLEAAKYPVNWEEVFGK